MDQLRTLTESKLLLSKAWMCEIIALGSMGAKYTVQYTLHDFNEQMTTVSIIITIIGGLGAIWNSWIRKKK